MAIYILWKKIKKTMAVRDKSLKLFVEMNQIERENTEPEIEKVDIVAELRRVSVGNVFSLSSIFCIAASECVAGSILTPA